MAAMARASLCSGSVAISAKQALPVIERFLGEICGSGWCAGAASSGRVGCGLSQISRSGDLGVCSRIHLAGALHPLGASGLEMGRKTLQGLRPFAGSFFSTGTISGRINIFSASTSVGLMVYMAAIPPKQGVTTDDDIIDTAELPEDDKDPLKHLLRLVKKMIGKLNKMPAPKPVDPVWYVGMLEDSLGKRAASNALTVGRVLKERWNEFYMVIIVATTCWSLEINLFQFCRIVKIVVLEKREEVHRKLEAYQRLLNKKPGEENTAEMAMAYSTVDLKTQDLYQQLLLARVDQAAIRSMVDQLSKDQPARPKGPPPSASGQQPQPPSSKGQQQPPSSKGLQRPPVAKEPAAKEEQPPVAPAKEEQPPAAAAKEEQPPAAAKGQVPSPPKPPSTE